MAAALLWCWFLLVWAAVWFAAAFGFAIPHVTAATVGLLVAVVHLLTLAYIAHNQRTPK